MKKYSIALLLFISLAIWSCTKNGATVPELTGVTGTWRYIGYSGGIAGFPFTAQSGSDAYVQLDTANARILISTGGKQACSDYTFEAYTADNGGVITIKDSITFTQKFDVLMLHDTLTLYPHDYADAFVAHYYPAAKHFTCDTDGGH